MRRWEPRSRIPSSPLRAPFPKARTNPSGTASEQWRFRTAGRKGLPQMGKVPRRNQRNLRLKHLRRKAQVSQFFGGCFDSLPAEVIRSPLNADRDVAALAPLPRISQRVSRARRVPEGTSRLRRGYPGGSAGPAFRPRYAGAKVDAAAPHPRLECCGFWRACIPGFSRGAEKALAWDAGLLFSHQSNSTTPVS